MPCRPSFQRTLALILPLLLLLVDHTKAGATAEAERSHYDTTGGSAPQPRFADYHALLDWYYAQSALGRTPTRAELRAELKDTMTYRLSQPQVYYEGTGYIPGVDEGWRPDVDAGEYRKVRTARDEEIRRAQQQAEEQEREEEERKKEAESGSEDESDQDDGPEGESKEEEER